MIGPNYRIIVNLLILNEKDSRKICDGIQTIVVAIKS